MLWWHPICPSAWSLWLPSKIWITSPVGQQIAWKFPCSKVGQKLWAASIQIHETHRWHGTSAWCTSVWEARITERSRRRRDVNINAKQRQWKYLWQFKIKKGRKKGRREDRDNEQGQNAERAFKTFGNFTFLGMWDSIHCPQSGWCPVIIHINKWITLMQLFVSITIHE